MKKGKENRICCVESYLIFLSNRYLHVMSRTDDIINVAGHRLSTGSIEQILLAHPQIVECCVVPLPDRMKGHVPLGIVVLQHQEGVSSDFAKAILPDLVAATRRDLGAIACFETAILVARLPKTRSGKILRRCIRDMVEGKPVRVPGTIEDANVLLEVQDALYENQLIAKKTLPSPTSLISKL
jgi:propionyl-CoA synthetase